MSFLSSSKERDDAGGHQTYNEPSGQTSEGDEASQLPLGGGGRGHPRRHEQYGAPRLRHQHRSCQCPHKFPQVEMLTYRGDGLKNMICNKGLICFTRSGGPLGGSVISKLAFKHYIENPNPTSPQKDVFTNNLFQIEKLIKVGKNYPLLHWSAKSCELHK